MRNFIDIIKEAMSSLEAKSIFSKHGVDVTGMDEPALKKARANIIRKVHPDAGGDVEDAKNVNAAFDTLKKNGTKSFADAGKNYSRWSADGAAGNSQGLKPNFQDLRYVKQYFRNRSAGQKNVSEWTIWNFDGRFFRGVFSVLGTPDDFPEMARVMRIWDRNNRSYAIFASKSSMGNKLYLIDAEGVNSDRLAIDAVEIEHDSFNGNPGNDKSFVDKLKDWIDEVVQDYSV